MIEFCCAAVWPAPSLRQPNYERESLTVREHIKNIFTVRVAKHKNSLSKLFSTRVKKISIKIVGIKDIENTFCFYSPAFLLSVLDDKVRIYQVA